MISVLSCSNDKTLKIWNYFPEQQTLSVLMTTEAHDNEINFVTVSPNYEFVATASKDKTAKVGRDSLQAFCNFVARTSFYSCSLFIIYPVSFTCSCGASQI